MEGEAAEDPTLFPASVGEKLRAAREAQGLDLLFHGCEQLRGAALPLSQQPVLAAIGRFIKTLKP